MTILVTGATGLVGKHVLDNLAGQGSPVRALTRSGVDASFPSGVEARSGAISDLDSLRDALVGVSTMFLLVPHVAEETVFAMQALDCARSAGVRSIVYLSVLKGRRYPDLPHFAAKASAERMLADLALPATVLRPSYFMQNDVRQKDAVMAGLYGMPIGSVGISMVDVRDVGFVAARELLRRERASGPLDSIVVPLGGAEALTGPSLARLWTDVLGRQVTYGGDDLSSLERRLREHGPAWFARNLAMAMRRYQEDGLIAGAEDVAATTDRLGREPRTYRAFAEEMAARWRDA